MVYDANSGKLNCHSCGRNDNIEDFPEENLDREFGESEAGDYHCENCGAKLLTDDDTVATNCKFCESGMIIGERLSGRMAPAKIIPFKIDKEKAQRAFRKWCGDGKLTPEGFMTADRIKNISGIYLPFWLYDLNTRARASGRATRVNTYVRGDYRYTETRHYEVYRDVDIHYLKVPADASEKMEDGLMDMVEPYNYEDLKEFKTPYLAGYLADKYNYDESELLLRVKGKVENYLDSYLYSTARGYTTVNFLNKDVDTRNKNAYYSFLPIWMVDYDYKGEEYIFAMNGQTGKVVGKPPISKKKIVLRFISVSLGVFLVLKLLIRILLGGIIW